MASFDDSAFSKDAFSDLSFDFDSVPPPLVANGKVITRVNAITKGSNISAITKSTRINATSKGTRVK